MLNINSNKKWTSTFNFLSWWKEEKVTNAKIMVVGAGAIGNEVLKNLALLNIGHIYIVDFDTIEYSNLSRSILFRPKDADKSAKKAVVASNRVEEINPNIKAYPLPVEFAKIGLGLIKEMDIVISCTDNRLVRLQINRTCFKLNKYWIDGAIENLMGTMSVYNPKKSCYECSLNEVEWQNIRFKLGCADVAKQNYSQGRIPTTPISASIIAAMQVQEALKVVHGYYDKVMDDKYIYYEGLSNTYLELNHAKRKDSCESHVYYDHISKTNLTNRVSIEDLEKYLMNHLKIKEYSLDLKTKLITRIVSRTSEIEINGFFPELDINNNFKSQHQLPLDEELMYLDFHSQIDHNFHNKTLTLSELGFADQDILGITSQKGEDFILLIKST